MVCSQRYSFCVEIWTECQCRLMLKTIGSYRRILSWKVTRIGQQKRRYSARSVVLMNWGGRYWVTHYTNTMLHHWNFFASALFKWQRICKFRHYPKCYLFIFWKICALDDKGLSLIKVIISLIKNKLIKNLSKDITFLSFYSLHIWFCAYVIAYVCVLIIASAVLKCSKNK